MFNEETKEDEDTGSTEENCLITENLKCDFNLINELTGILLSYDNLSDLSLAT